MRNYTEEMYGYRAVRALEDKIAALTPKPTAERHFFDGLIQELPKAAAEGRMAEWQKCADSIAVLIVSHNERLAESSLAPSDAS